MKSVTVNNVTYKSLAAAWRDFPFTEASYALARKRLSRGWDPEKAIVTPPVPPQFRRQGINQ